MDLSTIVEKPAHARVQDIFVPLTTHIGNISLQRDASGLRAQARVNLRPSLTNILRDEPSCIISGKAGCGKSTFLKFTCLACLEHAEELPILLFLKKFADYISQRQGENSELLLEWAGEFLDPRGLGLDQIKARMGRGITWLLDGLDEIFDKAVRLRVATILGAFIANMDKSDRIIITTRPHALQQRNIHRNLGIQTPVYEVNDLNEPEIALFLQKWFIAVHGRSSDVTERHVGDILHAVKSGSLSEISHNPLMLSLIAAIYQRGKKLPERRIDLYHQIVKALLENRFGPDAGGNERTVRQMQKGLCAVARDQHENNEIRDVGFDTFIRSLAKGIYGKETLTSQEQDDIEEKANRLGCHSGLLSMSGDPPRFSFEHLRFQEFLTACAFANEAHPAEAIRPYLDDDAWTDVVRLLVARLYDTNTGLAGQLLKDLYNEAQNDPRRLELALRGASETEAIDVHPQIVEELISVTIERLAEADKFAKVHARTDLALALGKVGDPRIDLLSSEFWIPLSQQEEQSLLMARYPITNDHYRHFLQDAGYQNRLWWCDDGWNWLQMDEAAFEKWFLSIKTKWPYLEPEFLRPSFEPVTWTNHRFNEKNQPLVGINWWEANAFCRWLKAQFQKKKPNWWKEGMTVQLPTRAQWLLAAAPDGEKYPWGNSKRVTAEHAHADHSPLQQTYPVGLLPKGNTPLGIADMAGNVWEWCLDNDTDQEDMRAHQGGCWKSPKGELRTDPHRPNIEESTQLWQRSYTIGFRCCITSES